MIHLISSGNAGLYEREIASLHRARKAVFVDELGWKLRTRGDQEFDEYDDERASTAVGFSCDGEVVMGLRFRPADDRSMLVDHFSHVLPAGIRPIDDGRTWELSRGFSREHGLRRHNLRRKAACMIAPLEIAYEAGIDRCVGFADVRMLGFCYTVGWKLNLLGDAAPYDEGDGVAYEVDVSAKALADMRAMWGLPKPAHIHIADLAGGASVHEAAEAHVAGHPELRQLMPQERDLVPASGKQEAARDDAYYRRFASSQ